MPLTFGFCVPSVELVVACLTETLQLSFSFLPSIVVATALMVVSPPDFAVIQPSALTETMVELSLLQDTDRNLVPSGNSLIERQTTSPTFNNLPGPTILILSVAFTSTAQPLICPLPSTASTRMTAIPTPFATTMPDGFTAATSGFRLLHSRPLFVAFLGYTVAAKLADSPTDSVSEDGHTCMH